MPFSTYLNLFTTYLPTYLPTHLLFFLNNINNNFNLGIKFTWSNCPQLTQSNGPIFTNQIVSHFVNHFVIQNDKVQFDCLIALDMYKMTNLN
jgi:hypothetical protein